VRKVLRNPVTCALHHMAIGVESGTHQRAPGLVHVGKRHHRILIAVNKQDRRFHDGFRTDPLGFQQAPRNRHHPCNRRVAAWRDLHCHHRALRKAHQTQAVRPDMLFRQPGIDPRVQIGTRIRKPLFRHTFRRAI
jgi:hypothetical protein